jgi:branched-chain amino acid transport system substrate-binding protein
MASENRNHGSKDRHVGQAVSRRDFLKMAGAAGATVGVGAGLGGLVAACGGTEATTTTSGPTTTSGAPTTSGVATTAATSAETGREIKVGFVDAITGPLAAFGTAGAWCVENWKAAVKDGLMCGDGLKHPVSIVMRDSQSDSNRAAQVAGDLIQNDKVDFIMAAAAPDTVNPVADQAEAMGCPCLTTDSPREPYFFGRGGTPDKPFKWTYHVFMGVSEVAKINYEMWSQLPNNKVVGTFWPNDVDGQAWSGFFGKDIPANGYKLVDPGLYTPGTEDFTAAISAFKKAGADICIGIPLPAEAATFLSQALQQDYRPKYMMLYKGLLFPEAIESLGKRGNGITAGGWWHPTYPYHSSLTGQTCQQLADDFEAKTGKQWTQPILHYVVFEWVVDVLKRTTNVDDKEEIMKRVTETKMADSVAGPIDFTVPVGPTSKRQVPNVYTTPLYGDQWRLSQGGKWMYDLVIVANSTAPDIALQDKIKPMQY